MFRSTPPADLSEINYEKYIVFIVMLFIYFGTETFSTLEVKLIIIYKIILIKAKVKRMCSNFRLKRKINRRKSKNRP